MVNMIEEVARPINRRSRSERTKRRERYLMLNNEKLSPNSQLYGHSPLNNNSIITNEVKKVRIYYYSYSLYFIFSFIF